MCTLEWNLLKLHSQGLFAKTVYGEKEIAVLFNHFRPVAFPDVLVTLEDVTDEWSTLRTLVYKRYSDLTILKWDHVISDMADQNLENVFQLIEIVLALPPTSVNCETAFSAMKLLTNRRRGRLGNAHLNDLMTIKIMSPRIEDFDPEPAFADWLMSTPSGKSAESEKEPDVPSASGSSSSTSSRTPAIVLDSDDTEVRASTSSAQPGQSIAEMTDTDGSDSDSENDDIEMSEELVSNMLCENLA